MNNRRERTRWRQLVTAYALLLADWACLVMSVTAEGKVGDWATVAALCLGIAVVVLFTRIRKGRGAHR